MLEVNEGKDEWSCFAGEVEEEPGLREAALTYR
jgi:hypothetical protein